MLNKLFNPYQIIGGLEVSDLGLRFLRFIGGRVEQFYVPLAPGTVVKGEIKDQVRLLTALRKLHVQIQHPRKLIPAVVVLPSAGVSAQSFTMPILPPESAKDAAELNMKMVAPADINLFHHSYEIIGQSKDGRLEGLAAFVEKPIADNFIRVLKEANFAVMAMEFPGLAISRLAREYGAGLEPERPYLLIHLAGDGLDLMIIKNGNIYFNYYYSWTSVQEEIGGRQISQNDVKEFLTRQIQKIITYHSGRSGKPFGHVLLTNSPINQELIKMLKENFSFSVQLLTIGRYSQVEPVWYSALGAAIRGITPKRSDFSLNLVPPNGFEKHYQLDAWLNFISVWRNVIAGILGFALLAFLSAQVYLIRTSAALAEQALDPSLAPAEEIRSLQESIAKFNRGVDLAAIAKSSVKDWSVILDKIATYAAGKISLEKLAINQEGAGLLLGKGVSDSAVVGFKNSLEKDPVFKDIVLPLSNIKVNPDKSVSFNLEFKVSF